MRAKLISENVSFKRNINPKKALGIRNQEILDAIHDAKVVIKKLANDEGMEAEVYMDNQDVFECGFDYNGTYEIYIDVNKREEPIFHAGYNKTLSGRSRSEFFDDIHQTQTWLEVNIQNIKDEENEKNDEYADEENEFD